MAFIPAHRCAKLVVSQSLTNGALPKNVLYVGDPLVDSPDYTGGDLVTLANAFGATWKATVGAVQTADITYESVTAYPLYAPGAGGQVGGLPAAAGHGGAGMIPSGIGPMLQFEVSGLAGKASHGRLYLCGVAFSNLQLNGDIASAFVSTVGGWLATWNTALQAAIAGTQLLYIRWNTMKTPMAFGQKYMVTSITCQPYCRAQRRRQG
jgi:hypothetical protein